MGEVRMEKEGEEGGRGGNMQRGCERKEEMRRKLAPHPRKGDELGCEDGGKLTHTITPTNGVCLLKWQTKFAPQKIPATQ